MSLNLLSFVTDMNRHIVFTKGEETLVQAAANPPKPDTPEFAKAVNVLEIYISGKKDRQDRAIALLCDQPILATTQVVSSIVKMMGEEKDISRCITLDRLGNLPSMVANNCKVAVYEDINNPVPSPRQLGALHNLLNLVDILVTGFQKKRGCVREIAEMAIARFEDNLPEHFTKRTLWAFDNRSAAPVEQAPAKSPVANGKTNVHADSHVALVLPVTNGTLGEKLATALGIKPEEPVSTETNAAVEVVPVVKLAPITPHTLVVAEGTNEADLMEAEMARLAGLNPESLDAMDRAMAVAKLGLDGGVEVHTAETQSNMPVNGAPGVPVSVPELVGAVQ